MALVDVEGVPVHLGELTLGHLMASRESIEEIVTKHYMRQLLHEMYKVKSPCFIIPTTRHLFCYQKLTRT